MNAITILDKLHSFINNTWGKRLCFALTFIIVVWYMSLLKSGIVNQNISKIIMSSGSILLFGAYCLAVIKVFIYGKKAYNTCILLGVTLIIIGLFLA